MYNQHAEQEYRGQSETNKSLLRNWLKKTFAHFA